MNVIRVRDHRKLQGSSESDLDVQLQEFTRRVLEHAGEVTIVKRYRHRRTGAPRAIVFFELPLTLELQSVA